MIIKEEDHLAHYGILKRSGRYPWGSGQDPHQRSRDFLTYVDDLRAKGLTDREIAQGMALYSENGKPWSTTEFRAARSIANNQKKQADIHRAYELKQKGYSNVKIGEEMGINESSVRALLAPAAKDKADILMATSNMLKEQIDRKGAIDVGAGVELHLGVSETKLKTAVAQLKEQGYKMHYIPIEQVGTGKQTTAKILAKPGLSWKEVYDNRYNIAQVDQIDAYSTDGGRSYLGVHPPVSVSSKRLAVRYKEQGGTDADGVIYLRPGVKDLDMGSSHYAQVRIAVDGTHFLKGMAIYKDDLPDGVDMMFNTNKSDTGNKLDALKPMKKDPSTGLIDMDNPFGAALSRQSGALNIVNEEGQWETWSKTLSSQFLSKQSPILIKSQLDMTLEGRKNQLDEIMQLTNPAVRKKMLESFADDADSAAVHLKAAALPRQASHVILPVNSLKETEVYAPNYKNGERVVLVRHPHGGTFEIPELTVNNNHPESQKLLGKGKDAARDAIGINAKVAERLSGADFDGDTVLVIPNGSGRVTSTRPLEGLKNFDPKTEYKKYDGMKVMDAVGTQKQMGDISNLITDMTIKGASPAELARAVRHSMVVIDAAKHELNYKQSAIDNGISQLKAKYQSGPRGGASTLISRKKQDISVPERKQGYRIDPATGKKIFTETGAGFVGRDGTWVTRTTKVKKLAEIDSAHELSSGTRREELYANYSDKSKALANEARKHLLATPSVPTSPSAKKVYASEVQSLTAKLNIALKNAPLERKAQLFANATIDAKRRANPDMDKTELKKVKGQALTEARIRMGAAKTRVEITDKEWEAIQAGAVSDSRLKKILDNADVDAVKKLATPRTPTVMTSSKQTRARQMLASGYSEAEVAAHLGVARSTLASFLEGQGGG